jgi:hypothetical protein
MVGCPLLELLRSARNLGRVRDGVAVDVDAPVENAVFDAERRRQAVDPSVRRAERAAGRLPVTVRARRYLNNTVE